MFLESLSYVYSSLWSEVLLSVISVGWAGLVDKNSFSTYVSSWKLFHSSTMAIFLDTAVYVGMCSGCVYST